MDIEETIQFLIEHAAEHDGRMAEIEKTNQVIQHAVLALSEHQIELGKAILQTNKALRDLGGATDRRIGDLVSAISKLAEQRPDDKPIR